ncbi:MAG: hypothetical protein DLM69_09265 [Candidatus Chloroheliales bacterium]|nr:MAG: hypothetical protein DLM69_09265 [Chloroflexota bacterium]
MAWPNLDPILKPINWAVIGGVATRLYMPERSTDDFDIAVNVADALSVRQRLADNGYAYKGELSIGGSAWQDKTGLDIDVIEGYEQWWPEALAQAQNNRDQQGLPIIPLPYLVLLKLKAGRLVDFGDLGKVLGIADEQMLNQVRSVIAKYSPNDREDLESLIYLGKLEVDNAS